MVIKEQSLITLDTNSLIYYFENHPGYADILEKLFNSIQNGKLKATISILTILEILVKPKKENNLFLENRYKLLLFNFPNLSVSNIDMNIVDTAALLRARYNIKTPDAIILATSIVSGSKYLISNDIRLQSICEAENIEMIEISAIE